MYNILRWACCQKFHSYLLYNNLTRVNEKFKGNGFFLIQVMDQYCSTQPCIHPAGKENLVAIHDDSHPTTSGGNKCITIHFPQIYKVSFKSLNILAS